MSKGPWFPTLDGDRFVNLSRAAVLLRDGLLVRVYWPDGTSDVIYEAHDVGLVRRKLAEIVKALNE